MLAVDLADSANVLRARWWTNPKKSSAIVVQDEVIRKVEAALTENAIDMPYPTQVVLFHDQTEETDGVRSQQREGWPSNNGSDPEPLRPADSSKRGEESLAN